MRPRHILLFSLLFAHAGRVYAEGNVLETIVVTGDPSGIDLQQLPLSVGVITQEEVAQTHAVHVSEIADRVAGVWLTHGNGQESLTAIRSAVLTGAGACGAFVTAEDGVAIRPPGFCNANQLFEINTEQASRIEILRGPASQLYGMNALNGVINVLSPDLAAPRSVILEGGPHDYNRALWSDHWTAGAFTTGVFAHTDHDSGYQDDSGYKQQKITVKQHYAGATVNVDSLLNATSLRQETAGYIEGKDAYRHDSAKNDNNNPQAYRDANAWRWQSAISGIASDSAEWQITPFLRHSNMDFLQHFIVGTPRETNEQTSGGVLWHWVQNDTPLGRLQLGGSVDYGNASVKEEQTAPTVGTFAQGVHYDFDVAMLNAALYAQLHHPLTERLSLDTAARIDTMHYDYDTHTPAGSTGRYTRPADRTDNYTVLSPSVSLQYLLTPTVQTYATLTRGARAPQVNEIYRLQGAQQVANVDPESVVSVELGTHALFERWEFNAAVFDMQNDHVIYVDNNRAWAGDGKTGHHGIEASARWEIGRGWSVASAWTWAEHRYASDRVGGGTVSVDGNEIDTAPQNFGSLQLAYDADQWHTELEWKHMGSYYLDPENTFTYPGHNLLNLRTTWQFMPQLALFARVMNLANEEYAERADITGGALKQPRYFVGEPRAVYAGVEYRY